MQLYFVAGGQIRCRTENLSDSAREICWISFFKNDDFPEQVWEGDFEDFLEICFLSEIESCILFMETYKHLLFQKGWCSMKLKTEFTNQAAGMDGRSRDMNIVFIVPVDRYMVENLIYLYHHTKGILDYRDRDELSTDDIGTILEHWNEVRNLSCIYRLFAHLLEVDTWRAERGSDA